jgi:predicted dienelactone hydrolase
VETFNTAGPPEIRGRIDLSRIAVAGFAEGASAAISAAGATRMLTLTATRANPNFTASARPVAFVAISPAGPGNEGFYDTDTGQPTQSWSSISRPVFSVTGAGDNTNLNLGLSASGDSPSMRLIPYNLMPSGGKYQMFLQSVMTDHAFLGSLDVEDCVSKEVEKQHCESHAEYLKSAVLAFLDGTVRKVDRAQTWLSNGLIEPASDGMVTWRKK